MQVENIGSSIANGSEVLNVLERRVNVVVGIFTSNARMHCRKPGQDFGFNIDCPDKKHAWIFNPDLGDRKGGDVRLWTLDEGKNVDEKVYCQGDGMAPVNVELVYGMLDYFVQGMLEQFPELKEKVIPYITAAKRKMQDGTIV